MRYLLTLLLLLLYHIPLWAGQGMYPVPMAYQASSSGPEDTCATDGLLVSWHMEDLDLANETGCSVVGDTVWEEYEVGTVELTTEDKSDGLRSGKGTVGKNYHVLQPTQNMNWTTEGTAEIDVRIDTFFSTHAMFRIQADNQNRVYPTTVGAADDFKFRFIHEGLDTVKFVICSASINQVANPDTWYRVKGQWNVSPSGGNYLGIEVWELDSSDPREPTGPALCTNYNTAVITTPVGDNPAIDVGMVTGGTGVFLWDNFKHLATSDL